MNVQKNLGSYVAAQKGSESCDVCSFAFDLFHLGDSWERALWLLYGLEVYERN